MGCRVDKRESYVKQIVHATRVIRISIVIEIFWKVTEEAIS